MKTSIIPDQEEDKWEILQPKSNKGRRNRCLLKASSMVAIPAGILPHNYKSGDEIRFDVQINMSSHSFKVIVHKDGSRRQKSKVIQMKPIADTLKLVGEKEYNKTFDTNSVTFTPND
jgi:hypothetical protein